VVSGFFLPASFFPAEAMLSPDPATPEEVGIEGTMRYCDDLGVNPEEITMLALAYFTKAPTMGRFGRKGWIDAWTSVR
jgi:DCN1-like protein 1/2